MDKPFYFGNTLAQDFLRLADNEWELPHRNKDQAMMRDYSILSVGCGDLRNLVYTIASLPNEFNGKLNITLCDFDAFVMARNVLFLYIMVAEADLLDIEKKLTTIWYSLRYSDEENKIVREALKALCDCKNGRALHEMTDGLIKMSDGEVQVLKQVWNGWHNGEHHIWHTFNVGRDPDCVKDVKSWHGIERLKCDEQKKSVLFLQRAQEVKNVRLRDDHPFMHRYSSDMWMQNGKFTTDRLEPKDLTHDNVTLTGRLGYDFAKRYAGDQKVYPYMSSLENNHDDEHPPRYDSFMLQDCRPPSQYPFFYCVQGDMNPYQVWDYIEARDTGYDDHMENFYFEYIRNCINLTIELIREKRLSLKMTIMEARQLKFDEAERFDRIFTSNLMDYFGTHPMVRKFGPLLNHSNKHAVLVMESLHWVESVKVLNGCMKGEVKLDHLIEYKLDDQRYNEDYHRELMDSCDMQGSPPHRPCIDDYEYDVGDFIKHLKGMLMVTDSKDDSKTVPSTKTLLQCDGFRMRDVRVGCNKVAPYRDIHRGRQGGIPGTERRTIEWTAIPSI